MLAAIDEINSLVEKYDFPLEILTDVNYRLQCCKEEPYIKQQLRYLKNLVDSGLVTEK
ncbi:DUF6877 family protein [Enterococcus sp. BWB1-3]|uniref:DUF6877 family protein n=1 Tax=Enterococcus sp. BWB1-3 TaxID=2787713 RepID=UPI002ED318FC